MRVLFIFPDLASDTTHYTGAPSYGLASMSAVLKAAGHSVDLVHPTVEFDEATFRSRVAAARPDLIGFSVNSHYARRLPEWTRWAREEAGVPVVVGGVHATLATEEVAALPHVDYTCVGEGEGAILDLCTALQAGEDGRAIANLWVRTPDGIVRNACRPTEDDLDAVPDPDLGLFDYRNLYVVRRGWFPYLMSRGCAFGCSYCCIHSLRKLTPRGSTFWRFLSPERAVAQMRALLDRYQPDADKVTFLDTILFPDRAWLARFAPLYRDTIGLPFSCNMRADLVDAEVADTLRDMGCRIVRFGVESGDEFMTRKVLTRGLEIEDIRRAFALLRERGIERYSYNIVGIPEENLRLALKTIRLNAEIDPELALAFIFYPYPGTRLHRICVERGYLTEREYDHYAAGVVTHLPTFRESDILFVHRFFRRLLRIYGAVGAPGSPSRRRWNGALDAVLAGPLFPRGAVVRSYDGYRRFRHRLGEVLVQRSPVLYRALGGTDPL